MCLLTSMPPKRSTYYLLQDSLTAQKLVDFLAKACTDLVSPALHNTMAWREQYVSIEYSVALH